MLDLSIDIDETLAFLNALAWSLFMLCPVVAVLVAFHFFDEWREDRMSKVEKLLRDRRFGGV